MKKVILLALALAGFTANAQEAYKGKGDFKMMVGANLQKNGTGLNVGADFGMGENISLGLSGNYLLGVTEFESIKAEFIDKIDVKARFNANLGKVCKLPEQVDVYPGLDLGLRNFGGRIGARYFFSEGFGLQAETGFPIAKYSNTQKLYSHLNNQFYVNLSAVFNL